MADVIADHIPEDSTPGGPGVALRAAGSARKVNAIGDLITVGRLAPSKVVANTPEGREELAGSDELLEAFASAAQGAKADDAVPNTPEGREALAGSDELAAAMGEISAPRWQPSVSYDANDIVIAPDGSTIIRVETGESRPSFDSTEAAAWVVTFAKVGTISNVALAARDVPNALDFGVRANWFTDQAPAINAALAALPNGDLRLPPGDFRCETPLIAAANQRLIPSPGTRIYAAAAMDALIKYDNGSSSASGYSQDKGIFGCGAMLDGALLADTVLQVSSVIRFTINGITIVDPVRRGIHLKSRGAEVMISNVRLHNTGTTNSHKAMTLSTTSGSTTVTRTAGSTFAAADVGFPIYGTGIPRGATVTAFVDANTVTISVAATTTGSAADAYLVTNIAIDAQMGDSHFSDIVIRDFTISVWNRGGANAFTNIHPWLGTASVLSVRFPYSEGYKLLNAASIIRPYIDTIRWAFRHDGAGSDASLGVQVNQPLIFVNADYSGHPGNLTAALATANPGAVFDCGVDGGRFDVVGGQYSGHPSAPMPFIAGNTRRFFAHGGNVLGSVAAFGDYAWGIKVGANTFTPTLEGTTGNGGTTYTAQEGYFEVTEPRYGVGFVRYTFRIVAKIGSGTTGNLRIGGLPYTSGATSHRPGQGSIRYATGVDATGATTAATNPVGPPWNAINQVAPLHKSSGGSVTPVAVPASGTDVEIWGELTIPYLHSTA